MSPRSYGVDTAKKDQNFKLQPPEVGQNQKLETPTKWMFFTVSTRRYLEMGVSPSERRCVALTLNAGCRRVHSWPGRHFR
jgi:hypothetical protein